MCRILFTFLSPFFFHILHSPFFPHTFLLSKQKKTKVKMKDEMVIKRALSSFWGSNTKFLLEDVFFFCCWVLSVSLSLFFLKNERLSYLIFIVSDILSTYLLGFLWKNYHLLTWQFHLLFTPFFNLPPIRVYMCSVLLCILFNLKLLLCILFLPVQLFSLSHVIIDLDFYVPASYNDIGKIA